MTWVKLDDKFHRNPKVMAMSDGAHRIYVDALSYCGDMPEPTGYLTNKEAAAFVKSRGKTGSVIRELVEINAWEDLPDGYMIHDFPEYLPQTSRDRTRRWRDAKRASQGRHGDVTEASPGSVTKTSQGVTAHARAVPDPDPVAVTPSVVTAPEPVPEPVLKAPPSPSVSTAPKVDALSNGQTNDPAVELVSGMQDILGHMLSGKDVLTCQRALTEYAYMDAGLLLKRAREHIIACESHDPKWPIPRTVAGFTDTWRDQNGFLADHGAPKAWRPGQRSPGMAKLSDALHAVMAQKDPDE